MRGSEREGEGGGGVGLGLGLGVGVERVVQLYASHRRYCLLVKPLLRYTAVHLSLLILVILSLSTGFVSSS